MVDATAAFFDELAHRGQEPLLAHAVGSIRFELVSGARVDVWRVGIDDGLLSVSQDEGDADCVVRCEKQLFDGIATGQVNALTALLRGALAFHGAPELLVRLQRLFPPPPAAVTPSGAGRS